jgi:hypothetical protein
MDEASLLELIKFESKGPILVQGGDLVGPAEIATFLDRAPSLTKPGLRADAKLRAKR